MNMKKLDAVQNIPVIIGEIAKKELTLDDVRTIFSAIHVAESEMGDGIYLQLSEKLYSAFPEIKKEHEQESVNQEREALKQTQARKRLVEVLGEALDMQKPLLPQIIEWVGNNLAEVHNSYSDEICVAADLYAYNLDIIARLSKELREKAIANHEAQYRVSEDDSEMWHYLADLLECERFDLRLLRPNGGDADNEGPCPFCWRAGLPCAHKPGEGGQASVCDGRSNATIEELMDGEGPCPLCWRARLPCGHRPGEGGQASVCTCAASNSSRGSQKARECERA